MMDGQPSFLGAYLSSLAPILQREDLVEIAINPRSEEHTSELQSHHDHVCRPLLEKKT